MKIYKCEKCGSIDVFIECNETHHGLYCGDCGKWIKWLNKDEERLVLRQIINQQSKNKNEESIRADERAKTLEEVLKRSIIIHGDELYGSQTKLLLFTEEVFNKVFKSEKE